MIQVRIDGIQRVICEIQLNCLGYRVGVITQVVV